MSSAYDGRSHYRWRLQRLDGLKIELRFAGGITRRELELMYRGCRCEPVAPESTRSVADDDSSESDDT